MSTIVLGRVRSKSGKTYEVKWNQSSQEVYVGWGGWTYIGKACSANEAMQKAEAWLIDK